MGWAPSSKTSGAVATAALTSGDTLKVRTRANDDHDDESARASVVSGTAGRQTDWLIVVVD